MAPKRNKQACNAFYYFMLDVQGKGAKRISLAEASVKAAPLWQRMGKDQREPYDRMAKAEKERQRDGGDKYTCDGKSLALQEHEEQMKKDKESSMQTYVRNLIQTGIEENSIKQLNFYFIDINIFCVTTKDYYAIAELAVSKFSFEKGVYDTFHTHINPLEIPIGYKSDAIQHTNETHQLPLPPSALGEDNMEIVMTKLLEFLTNDNESLPYLYTLPKYIPIVEGALMQLCEEAGYQSVFKVFNLAELFMNFMNNFSPAYFDNAALALMELEKDVYDYYPGLGCEYHEASDAVAGCSLSKAKRWAYIIADYCCQHLKIEIIPGFHLPEQAAIKPNDNQDGFTKKERKRTMNRAGSSASVSTVHTLPRGSSAASTPAPSLASSPPRLSRPHYGEYSSDVRSTSPTESMISSVSKMTVASATSTTVSNFPLSEVGNKWNSGASGLEAIRRPVTQAQARVAKGTAASALLGYSTTDMSSDEGAWPTIGGLSNRRRRGTGRGIAAKFSNP